MLRLPIVYRLPWSTAKKTIINQLLRQSDSELCRLQCKNYFSNFQKDSNVKAALNTVRSIVDQQNVFMGPFGDVEIPSGIYVHQFIWKDVDKWWNKTALVCAASHRSYSYGELRRLCGRFATSLRRNNLRPGDTLAVWLPNIPEFVIIMLGASEAGVKVTLLNPAYTVWECSYQIENCHASAVITTQEKYSLIATSIKEQHQIRLPAILIPCGSEPLPAGTINFRDLVADGIEEFEKTGEPTGIDDKNDTILLPYSSGTTGLPKGVELTHRNLVANLTQLAEPSYTFSEPAVGEFQEILPTFLPLYHIYGLVASLYSFLSCGGKLILMPEFTSNNLLDVLENNEVTELHLAPPVVQLIANDSRFSKKHMERVKCVMSGAAPLGLELITKFQSKMSTNCQFTQAYGLTETSPMITKSKYSDCQSVGLISVNTRIRIVGRNNENTGMNLGIDETGEIVVKGPQVMKGYYKNTKATEDCMEGEWFKTGDLGYINDKGELFVTERVKELIKVKGYQVAPAELENVIYGHDSVADVAVIGIPHEKFGEAPKAFIVLKTNAKTTEEEIKNYVAERLAKYKHIDQVQFIDQIPKSTAGKILKKKLRQLK